ncbi:sulfatase [Akkermansiaceae bacterium]|nr:sulfatase [Akkermansiaceae bacterium]MDB4283345.1 sulfatase [Akkermansiaceae bacterium]MDB4667593.1 sulfatase [Akkermansiaceae bacterium]MDB4781551.1 sulfatase [Akkermansiaceae bacterium]MDB4820279.1 sulfatase [Akkermansiaceae bacterium]
MSISSKLLLAGLSFFSCLLSLSANEKPNIIYIMADDCTFNDLGCYGGQAKTPHIDQLATEGMLFEKCFQAAPMCSPTRHNIYTGLYPVRSGAYPNHTFVKEGTKSLSHYLKPLGYRVALSGKTHISPRDIFKFEYSAKGNNPDMAVIESLMVESKKKGTPFCLLACSNEPHTPWDKGDTSQYPPAKVELPSNLVDTPETREGYSKYLAEITYYDQQVGDVLALLKKHGLAENTLVVVTSEQGSEFPFAKWTCYDAGLQSAMIARWPGKIAAGKKSKAMVEYVDLCPTFIEVAGGKIPEGLDGKSFLPVLKGEKQEHKKHVFGMMTTRGIINGSEHYGIRSVRSETHKLIVNLTPDVEFRNIAMKTPFFLSWEALAKKGDARAIYLVNRFKRRPAIELYNVVTDPLETKNIAGKEENSEIIKSLRKELNEWMLEQGDLGQATEMDAGNHQAKGRKKGKKKK